MVKHFGFRNAQRHIQRTRHYFRASFSERVTVRAAIRAAGSRLFFMLRIVEKKLREQFAHLLGLLLLHPMSSPLQKMYARHSSASRLLHFLEISRGLKDGPVAFPANKERRDINRTAGEQSQFRGIRNGPSDGIAIQSALEPSPSELRAIDLTFS